MAYFVPLSSVTDATHALYIPYAFLPEPRDGLCINSVGCHAGTCAIGSPHVTFMNSLICMLQRQHRSTDREMGIRLEDLSDIPMTLQ